jgi:hypothetical protein
MSHTHDNHQNTGGSPDNTNHQQGGQMTTTNNQEVTPTTQNSSENNGLQLNRDQLNKLVDEVLDRSRLGREEVTHV